MKKRVMVLGWWVVAAILPVLTAAQEGVTLRYSWAPRDSLAWTMTMKVTGAGTITTPQGTEPVLLDVLVSVPLFMDVLGVSDEGLATVRLSVGLIVTEISMPGGGVMRVETDLQTGKVVTRAGGAEQVTELPGAAQGLLVNSFEMVLDDRGQVKELRLPDEVRAAMGLAMRGLAAGAGDLAQWANWLEPPLPQEPVIPGATWQTSTPLGGLLGSPEIPEVVTVYRYEGLAEIDGVACHKITAHNEAHDVDMTLPAALGMGIETRLEKLSISTDLTAYLSSEDSHLALLEGIVTQSGTIHQKGVLEQGGQQVAVDQTVRVNEMQVALKATRE